MNNTEHKKEKSFDPAQRAVLDCTVCNQLVSAGAGSGKTTVMIKKISDLLISNEIKPDEIVVLTFTNLAANEMKQRLIKSINDKISSSSDENELKNLFKILNELETSYVDTIDGFCSKMVKKYFYKLNINPNLEITTGLTQEYYINTALEKAISLSLEKCKEDIIELSDCFETNERNFDTLKANLLNAFHFVMTQYDYDKFLQNAENEYLGYFNSAKFLNSYLVKCCKENIKEINYYINDLANYNKYFEAVKSFLDVLNNINEENDLITNVSYFNIIPNIPSLTLKNEDSFSGNIVKKAVKNIKNLIDDFAFLNNFKNFNFKDNSKHLTNFINLLKLFIDCYCDIKHKYNVVDFTDLERQFLNLMKCDDVAKEINEQYKYIFVDEFQDINPMQNEIIEKLASNQTKKFFVGDVKQSIYGFRQSTPELFLELYNKYKNNSSDGYAFDMNINFRSNPQILEFNNEIFTNLMTEEKTDINYNLQKFEPKRTDLSNDESVEIAVFNDDNIESEIAEGIYSVKDSDYTKANSSTTNECLFIADKIISMVGQEFYDGSLKQMRNLQFNDIAILSRGINDAKTEELINVLRSKNIPIKISNKITLKECESINLLYNILKVIANIGDDVSYMAFLTSSLCNFTFNEIFEITSAYSKLDFYEKLSEYSINYNNELSDKIKKAFNLIDEIRLNSFTKNNLQLIDMLLYKYHLKEHILNSKNGKTEFTVLQNFLSTINEKENSASVEEFLLHLQLSFDSDTEYSQNDAINSVVIQTIHASKGLEYPVVFIFNASKDFRPNNDKDIVNFDADLGIGLPYFNLEKRIKFNSVVKFAIKLKNKIRCYKEELRLLYVASTRPQNRLIITGSISFKNIVKNNLKSNNFLELIYTIYQNQLNLDDEKITLKNCIFYHFNEYESKFDIFQSNQQNKKMQVNKNLLEFEYPNSELLNISLKNNVTSISKEINKDFNILPQRLQLKENLNAVLDNVAEIGTAYHKALSQIDFKKPYCSISMENIDENLIKLAYTKLKPLTENAINIKHEAQFLMCLPYNEIYKDSNITEKVLIQGVVDMIIEFNDHFVLLDFKYSKSNINTLKERYKTQLELYKLAIEKTYHKPVTESYIYHINSGKIK